MLQINKLVLVIVLALNQISSDVPRKLQLTVYYESRCPDSRVFIVEQLKPTVNLLHDYLKLKLVPFGKADSINNGYGGFKCQHGPTECTGNLVQSCALDLMQERNNVEKVSYVTCEMQKEYGTRGSTKCATMSGLSSDDVIQCVSSSKGTSLQLNAEYLTKLIRPRFIPTIVIGGVFNQQLQDSSLRDLKGTLCSILKETPPCAEHYNSLAMDYVLY